MHHIITCIKGTKMESHHRPFKYNNVLVTREVSCSEDRRACFAFVCKIPLLGQAQRGTIGYLVYKLRVRKKVYETRSKARIVEYKFNVCSYKYPWPRRE